MTEFSHLEIETQPVRQNFLFSPPFLTSRDGLVKCTSVFIPGEKIEGSLQFLNNASKMHLRPDETGHLYK